MNKEKRKALGNTMDAIEAFRSKVEDLHSEIETIIEAIQIIRDDEQEAFDNMPESLQCGEKGVDMELAVDNLDSVIDSLDEVARALQCLDIDDILSKIEDARGQS